MTSDEHIPSLTLAGCGLVGFPSASQINCLTSPIIKTPRSIFRNARMNAAHIFAFTPIQPVPNWFQVLFTSRQGSFSAFDHSTCQLSVSSSIQNWKFLPPIFTRDIQRTLLRSRLLSISTTHTGLSPSLVRRSRSTSTSWI